MIVFTKVKSESREWLGRSEPHEAIRAPIESWLKVLCPIITKSRIDPIGADDQVEHLRRLLSVGVVPVRQRGDGAARR